MPYPDFMESVVCLDRLRLNKQRVEAYELIQILCENKESRWANHPACKMWKGYEEGLKLYFNCCLTEWMCRGYANNYSMFALSSITHPKWFGDQRFHSAHRIALLCKDFGHYSKHFLDPLEQEQANKRILENPDPKKRTGNLYFWPTEHKEYQ